MGRPWFPLALLGFGLLAMVVFSVGYAQWFDYGPYSALDGAWQSTGLGTRDVSGATYATAERVSADNWGPFTTWGPHVKYASTTWLVLNIGVFLGTVVFFAVRARRRGTPIRRRTLVGLLLGGPLVILLADLTVFWELKLDGDLRGPLVTTAGLLLLAWIERSRLVLAVAVLFALVDVVVLGGVTGVLAAAAVVFAGAFAVLLWTPRRRLSGNVENGPGEH
jgi:hypothetical protein